MIEAFAADATSLAHAAIAEHSRSHALAAQLLPASTRDSVAVLYAYCRRADDAVEFAPEHEVGGELQRLRAELDAVYAGAPIEDPIASSFQLLVRARGIPRPYVEELIAGLEMDALGVRYTTRQELLRYCYRVAGTVGLMTAHVLGVRDDRALPHAAHLGIAMQLTTLCRNVLEDWQRGRLYLPAELLSQHGAPDLHDALGAPFPDAAAPAVARATAALLDLADAFHASADAGIRYLPLRCAFAVRAARLVYAELGAALRRRGCDPRAKRTAISAGRKQLLAARAAASAMFELASRSRNAAPGAQADCASALDALLQLPLRARAPESLVSAAELGRTP